MKTAENLKKYKEMKISELISELKEKKNEFAISSLRVKAGKEDNFSIVEKLRKDIARIKTTISEKQSGETNE